MRKNKFLAALAIAACLATSVPLSASAATLGQAASASEVTYGTVSVADQAKIKEIFVAADYAELNPDLVAAGLTGDALFNHFITAGLFEGRQANKNFNVAVYRSAYADLQKEFGNDLVKYYVHYAAFGKAEGRKLTTVEAAKENGVEVKSLFSDKVILDKVAAPAASTSTSNPAPAPSTDKPEEETKPTDEKVNEEAAKPDYESEKNFPINDLKSQYTGFTASLGTIFKVTPSASLSPSAAEAKFVANVEYDYTHNVFFDCTAVYTSQKFKYDVPGNYWKVDEHKYAELIGTSDGLKVKGTPNSGTKKLLGYNDGHGYTHVLNDLDVLPIKAGDVNTGNNNNTGFIDTTKPVVADDSKVVKGKLNPAIWYLASDGKYHKIASDWELYHKNGVWNFKTDSTSRVEWEEVVIPSGETVFRRTNHNTLEYGLNVKATGYLRTQDDLKTAGASTGALYYSAYRVSTGAGAYTNTISDAGNNYNTYVRNAAGVSKKDAYTAGGRKRNVVDGINVGKFVNEYFEITPMDGYYLDDNCEAWRFSTDYHDACNINTRDFIYEGGYWISVAGYTFTADEISKAMYVQPGYAWYQGQLFEVLAKDESDGNRWYPSEYQYVASKDKFYLKGEVYDEATWNFTKVQVADERSVEVLKDDNTGTILRPIIDSSNLAAIFADYNNNTNVKNLTYKQLQSSGRFYLE